MSKTPSHNARKLAGTTIAFVGKFGYVADLDAMKALAAAEGATIVDAANSGPDYLVAGAGVRGNPPAAVAKVQKKHPQVQVLDPSTFYQMVNPTAAEFLEIMLSGPHGHDFWGEMQHRLCTAGKTLDLTGTDFRNRTIEGIFYRVCLDECDFRGATISAYFDKVTGSKFDGAVFSQGSFTNAEDCSLKNVTMNDVRWNPAEFIRCDFSGAKLNITGGSFTRTRACDFNKADLHGSELRESTFASSDFRNANLADAMLEKCDFSNANLSGADLSRADLRHANFTNADLREATLKDARLAGADLTGASIDHADFTGAIVAGANLTGLNATKAKNLVPMAARLAGPNLRELAIVAAASKSFTTTIEMKLGVKEMVTFHASFNHYGSYGYTSASYVHEQVGNILHSGVDSPSFEQGMINLADQFSRGVPGFDTVKVEAKKCPLRGRELRDLAIAAWHEACGVEVPKADELEAMQRQTADELASFRETLVAELQSPAGVKKWNARTNAERKSLGKMRRHDFTNAQLADANLQHLDLEGCKFDGARLNDSFFCETQLKKASFANADLAGANFASCKCSDATFENAVLTRCNLRNANFRRCNFQKAVLSGADFSYSDLGGADLSGTDLRDVQFLNTKFDEKTLLPAGFVPPVGMDWKGAGVRPGTPPAPPPPKPGTLDFDAFLNLLNNKVEAARMRKAGSMLKAERFHLFAEVTDDALVGVVKSQTNHELVYSCRLAADGAFSCCTQNLRPCGGLRGALCKHLLVLIVGMAKADKIDAGVVDHWIEMSKGKKPAIDENLMSATFLRYKGAEAGEIDWRPTETIPEDFYAM